MVKSPEQYLSSLSFSLSVDEDQRELNPGERAFVEKYLGMDMFQKMPEQSPEPLLKPAPAPLPQKPLALMERSIVVAPPKQEIPARAVTIAPPVIEVAPAVETPSNSLEAVAEAKVEPVVKPVETTITQPVAPITPEITAEKTEDIVLQESKTEQVADQAVERITKETEATRAAVSETVIDGAPTVAEVPRKLSMRERLREETEIQMVSFYVSGQLFLLPVPEIQEVLRHMELVRVPQAPAYVAGAINLRGHVMPLIHLSALLTNERVSEYTDKNFIIVCGADDLRLGLIIDKISSMHLVPRNKIIWNVEAMLGEAAEVICGVANLDEKVTGIVDPDMITRKLLSN